MRDSSGYNIPHTGQDLRMIYSLNVRNRLDANRLEAYVQDTWRFSSKGGHTLFTLNYGLRFSHWNFNKESILSPRVSLGIIPAFNHNVTLRFATGVYYQAPFFKELRDTATVNGITTATLNRNAKSQRSIHFIAGFDYRFKMKERLYKFTAEAYYKDYARLPLWEGQMLAAHGFGYSTGLDFFFIDRASLKNVEYRLSYTYNISRRRYLDYTELTTPQ